MSLPETTSGKRARVFQASRVFPTLCADVCRSTRPSEAALSPSPPVYDRRAVVAWSVYDFANSAFTTLVVTFIYATFFTVGIAADKVEGTALWSLGVTNTVS